MLSRPISKIILLWLAWIFILLGFQAWSGMRFQVRHPDYALEWTPIDTALTYKHDKPYLNEPFMNQQVAFDSEYYLSIATVGYADPEVSSGEINGKSVPLNYAFMPFYPLVMKLVALPLKALQMTPIATSTLAGVIVSVLGTLAGMVALYDLTVDESGSDGGLRAAFYLLIYPAGCFLAMVYTEGLFVGLAFTALALIKRKQWIWAALLSIFAVLTRAVGVALLIPLGIAYARSGQWKQLGFSRTGVKPLVTSLVIVLPLLAYLLWRFSYLGQMFQQVEHGFFGRGLFAMDKSFTGWGQAFSSLFSRNPQTSAYYMLEFGATLLGLLACFFTYRRYPEIALFSLAVIMVSLTSGYPQGMHRYVMTAPAVFIFLARLGKHQAFDRLWTIFSTLLMGVLALLFASDMWAG